LPCVFLMAHDKLFCCRMLPLFTTVSSCLAFAVR
jgi:hypothetical protein